MTDRRILANDQDTAVAAFERWTEGAATAARTSNANGVSTFAALGLPLTLVDKASGITWRFTADTTYSPAGELVLSRKTSGIWVEIVRF